MVAKWAMSTPTNMFLRTEIIRRADDGRALHRFTDALGITHMIPVSDGGDPMPGPALLPCEVLARRLVEGRELVQIDTDGESGSLLSLEGLSWFTVSPDQLTTTSDI